MKKIFRSFIAIILSVSMLCCVLTLLATTASATTGYDRGYTGAMPGDGKIYAEGLDVSSWQGDSLNFADIKAAGFSYVIIRCGTTKGKDTYFEKYYTQAKSAGLNVGAYYYSYADTTDKAYTDASNTLKWIAGKTFEYPIYFDFEDAATQGSLSNSARKNICYAYMDTLRDAGYLVGMYSMASWLTQDWVKSSGIYDKYEGWVAHYVSGTYDAGYDKYSPTYSKQFGMYQYTSMKTFTVNGRSYGPLDANVCYKDYPAIVKKYGFNGYELGRWEEDSKGWRYFNGSSYLLGWQKIDGEWYYFNDDTYMHTGWIKEDGKMYYLNPANGIMQRGWIYVNGEWYYTDDNGAMVTGWIQPDDGAWYYLNSDGTMARGWIQDGDTTYYLNQHSGAMVTGWTSVDGEWHEFSSSGVYFHNTAQNLGKSFVAKLASNLNMSKLVSLESNNVVIRSDDGGKDQMWRFDRQEDGSYKITNLETGWCLDVQDGKSAVGTNIQTWEDIGGNPQRWVMTDDKRNGNYTFRPLSGINKDNVMDVLSATATDGSNIVISTENGGLNQSFAVYKMKMGDIDFDDVLSIKDVTQIQKILSGEYKSDNDNIIADINGNGKLDIRDATYIQLYVAKIINRFPNE